MDSPQPPGMQHWVHMEKAGMDLRVEQVEVELQKIIYM
jgi:hypothetical protein